MTDTNTESDTGTDTPADGTVGEEFATKGSRRQGIEIFDGPMQAPSVFDLGMMTMPTMEPEAPEELMEWAFAGGNLVRTLFHRDGDPPMTLVWAWFGPDLILPRHSHDADCLYVVLTGELVLGNRRIGPGGGFFVPADAPYAYRAGPEGVQVLEFRNAMAFDMHITESMGRWERIVEVARENGERWQAEAATFEPEGADAE